VNARYELHCRYTFFAPAAIGDFAVDRVLPLARAVCVLLFFNN